MMLDHFGHGDAAAAVVRAIERILGESDTKTPDLGGGATTSEVGEAIAAEARALMA
jgi:tartrate dehydrogenase/decarboxylase/D-malate dehydrogenase